MAIIYESGNRENCLEGINWTFQDDNIEDEYTCQYCDEEITFEQVKHVVPAAEKEITEKILVYLNKYRKDYKLDTCLRKAHFIAQIGAEMSFKKSKMKEGASYHHGGLSIFGNHFSKNQVLDSTILDSLEDHLISIFKITDKDDKTIEKTNSQLKSILSEQNLTVNARELYGRRDKKADKEEILKTVKETILGVNGEKTEITKFNIVLLKHNESFGIETLSRAYANRYGNGDELSRDGYMFSGKGVKQITFKDNYASFSEYREQNPFPDDPNGYIDFTEITDINNCKGKFDLLADTNEVIYGVQSALWFFQLGNVYSSKYTVDWADKDNLKNASLAINGGYNGLKTRRDNTFKAREANGFKVYKHYKDIYENGNPAQRKEVQTLLENLSKDDMVNVSVNGKMEEINLKDNKAEELLHKLLNVKLEQLESIKSIDLPSDSLETKKLKI